MLKRKYALEKKARGHHEASPITPIAMKKRSDTVKENISMTICYTGEISEYSERRITRSVSRQMRENSCITVDLSKFSESESKKRRALHSAGQVRGTHFDKGKDRTVSRGVRGRKKCQVLVNHEKDGKFREGQQAEAKSKGKIVLGLCVPMVQRNKGSSKMKKMKSENLGSNSCAPIFLNSKNGLNSDRVVTRSASKSLQEKADLCGEIVVREISHTSSKVSAKKEKLENQVEKRITRSSVASFSVIHEKDKYQQKNVGNFDRMVTRSASKSLHEKIDFSGQIGVRKEEKKKKIENTNLAKLPKAKKQRVENSVLSECHVNQSEKRIKRRLDCELDKASCDSISLRKSRDGICEEHKVIEVERNSGKIRVQGTNNKGWTKDQETALQNAFLTAKPSPHFWKKVSKLVPGKTAQQCFDKINSNIQTPPSTQPLSRVRKVNSPSTLSFPISKLTESTEKKSKKTRKTKPKSHIAHRNVRHLLQKYTHVKQHSEADLFSVLEPTMNPSTPINKLVSPVSGSVSHTKRLSRFSGVSATPLTSPPVLKKVKNLALHEKYIDQLHIREAKRKVASARYLKAMRLHKKEDENGVVVKDVIKAAKDALCSDAKDAIHKFQESQGNLMETCSDSEEFFCSDEDEDEESML